MRTERVTFASDGIELVGDLRVPGDASGPMPGLVFTGPFTGVRDQVAGVYADQLAEAGYVTLAFDHRNFGESGGSPRQHEDAQGKVHDLREAVTYLSKRPEVAASKIGAVGICLGGGYAVRAAAFDRRIAAVASVAGGFNSPAWFRDQMGTRAYQATLAELMREYADEPDKRIPAVALEGVASMPGDEPFAYYGTERGRSSFWRNEVTAFSTYTLLTFNTLGAASFVSPTPLLIVHGRKDDYCSPEGAQAAYEAADEPKRIVWLDTTNHIDLYDQQEYVGRAIGELADHFGRHLAGRGVSGS
ncbi:alpha/beta hydrolase [Tenggerimyces flavus]|uniref:Alpha/beta hydrolase n=1 Tax=Tenggerimyces flavus TaxID=1708749 RepID=A0ABV7Y9W8_9ACTN|nr:alpha/beta hydrolase [Tenggerimyces flavus]MBM7791041.1 fermentation-respiration switch protein FrsA (DUF1100 family) [Tenggerimyces flavus]